MLAFMDDRKTKMMRDEMERESREARESARASGGVASPPPPSPVQSPVPMPGLGHTLASVDNPDVDQPPPYQEDS